MNKKKCPKCGSVKTKKNGRIGHFTACKMTYTPKKLRVLCIFAFRKDMFLGGMHIRFAWKGIKLQPAWT